MSEHDVQAGQLNEAEEILDVMLHLREEVSAPSIADKSDSLSSGLFGCSDSCVTGSNRCL
jgi:hypothetical protein